MRNFSRCLFVFILPGLFFCFLGYGFYASFSTLGDAAWLPFAEAKSFSESLGTSTDLTIFIYSNLELYIEYWPFVVVLSMATSVLIYLVYGACEHKRSKVLCLAYSFLPITQMWVNSANKEALYIVVLLSIFLLIKKIKKDEGVGLAFYWFLLLVFFYLAFLFKPQYFPILLFAYFAFFSGRLSIPVLVFLCVFLFFPLAFIGSVYFVDYLDYLVLEIPRHFASGDSTRHIPEWDGFYGYILSSFIYFDFIVFNVDFLEVCDSYSSFAVFSSSLLAFIFIASCFCFSVFFRGRLMLGEVVLFLLAFLYLYFSYVPFGIFNPGSALRYSANLHAVILFISLIKIEFGCSVSGKEKCEITI